MSVYDPISPPGAARARFRPATPGPLAERNRQRLERLVARFERDDIEAAVDGLIAMLDQLDGDTDMEDDDRSAVVMRADATDRDYADEPLPTPDGLAGDPIDAEDEGHAELSGDELGDQGWTEWHGRSGVGKRLGREVAGAANTPDDAEDDDPAEQDDEPEENGDREEVNEDGSDPQYATRPLYGPDQSLGPINHQDAQRAHMVAVYGLVPSTSNPSGWRHRS